MPKPQKPQETTVGRAACYHRISVDSDESTSIDAQRELTRRWCEANGFEVVDFTDEGISGSGKVTRPAWDSMIAEIKVGKIQVVVVKDMSRLARNIRQTIDLADLVRIVTVEGGVDTDTATGKLLLQLLSTFAEFEREQAVARQTISQRHRRGIGRSVGSIPYGFQNVHVEGQGAFRETEEREAGVIKEVVTNVIAGASVRSEADRLNTEKRFTRKGNKWSAATLAAVIDNPSIAGLTPVNGGELLTDEDNVPIHYKHLEIISLAKWKKLQAAREHGRKYRNHGNSFDRLALAGLVFCANCGRRCTRKNTHVKGVTYPNYNCSADTNTNCDSKAYISSRKLEEYVAERLAEDGKNDPVVKGAVTPNTAPTEEKDDAGIARRQLIRLEIDAASEQIRTASPADIGRLAERIAGLRELHDSIPIVKEVGPFTVMEFEEYDLAEWASRDLAAAAKYAIHQIKVSQAGGNTRAPAAERVEIIYHDDVDWDDVKVLPAKASTS